MRSDCGLGEVVMTPTSREEKGHQTQFPTQPCCTHAHTERGPPCTSSFARWGCDAQSLSPIPTDTQKNEAKNTQQLSEDTIKSNQSQKKSSAVCPLAQIEEGSIAFKWGKRKNVPTTLSFVLFYYYLWTLLLLSSAVYGLDKENVDNKILLWTNLKYIQYMM